MSQLKEYFEPQKKTAYASLPFIMRPARDESFIVFTSERDGFAAFIHHDVRDAISQEAYKAAPNETIGLLAGRVLRDERGPYTLVLAAQGARRDEIEATPSHVRISAGGQAQVRSRLECSAYGLDIIGWYHSHPRYPARFSSVDVTEQSTWRDPNHLGIVISGTDTREPLGVYRGPQATLLTPVMFEIPHPKKTVQPDTALMSPPVEEHKPEAVAATQPVATSWTAHTPKPVTEGMLRFLPLALIIGLLGTALTLIWFQSRIAGVERSLARARLNKEGTTSAPPPVAAPTPLPSSSLEERTPPKEATTNDRLIAGDNPVTKANPLLPGAVTPPKRHAKSRKNLKTPAKDASRLKSASGGDQPGSTKRKEASSPTKTQKPDPAPDNKPKSQPEDAAGKPVRP
jgi:proteasome lid subunit RPN8/RPN11